MHTGRSPDTTGRIGRLVIVALALALVAAACGDDGDGSSDTVSIGHALGAGDGDPVTVEGYLHHVGWLLMGDVEDFLDEYELCEVVVDTSREDGPSTLHVCGGDSISVDGLTTDDFELRSDGSHSWTAQEVQLSGTVMRDEDDDATLVAEEILDTEGAPTRSLVGIAQTSEQSHEVEITVWPFRDPSGDIRLCDSYEEEEVGLHPFFQEPVFDPSACAAPAAVVTNPDILADVSFRETEADAGGEFTSRPIVVTGSFDEGSDGAPELTIGSLVADSRVF